MDQELAGALNLEEVRQRFDVWRARRKRGAPIPAALWADAVNLCAHHSLSSVCSVLHLEYNVLKKRLQSAFPERFSQSEASRLKMPTPNAPSINPSGFIAVDLSASLPEYIVEMERAGGRMRIHIKGMGFQPVELIKSFWGRG